jgi:hypothetical protein
MYTLTEPELRLGAFSELPLYGVLEGSHGLAVGGIMLTSESAT